MTLHIYDASGRIIALASDNRLPERAPGPWDRNTPIQAAPRNTR